MFLKVGKNERKKRRKMWLGKRIGVAGIPPTDPRKFNLKSVANFVH